MSVAELQELEEVRVLVAKGRQTGVLTYAEVATALAERDRSDSTRADSPLARAADAIHIETTDQPIEAVVDRVLEIVRALPKR